METFETLFQISVFLFLTCAVFWLVATITKKEGIRSIYITFTYPTTLVVILGAIIAMLKENLSLNFKLILGGIALIWGITFRVTEGPAESRKGMLIQYLLIFISLVGAWILADKFLLAHG